MAGAIPICLSPRECNWIRMLTNRQLVAFVTELDENGWMAARERLRAYHQPKETEDTQ